MSTITAGTQAQIDMLVSDLVNSRSEDIANSGDVTWYMDKLSDYEPALMNHNIYNAVYTGVCAKLGL